MIVGTPDHWHALPTVMALPRPARTSTSRSRSSLTIGEGRVMVDAARRHNRVVQMGTQQRSAHALRRRGRVREERHSSARSAWSRRGPTRTGWATSRRCPTATPPPTVDYDMWLGPAPKRPFNKNRFHFNFRWYYDYSGGLMTDWGAHMIDIANWGMGVTAPKAATSVGGKFGFPDDAEETPDTQQALWECDGFSMIWEHATAIGQGPYMRDHGVAFHGNNGVLVVDRGGWEVLPETETQERQEARTGWPASRAAAPAAATCTWRTCSNFLDCMDSRKRAALGRRDRPQLDDRLPPRATSRSAPAAACSGMSTSEQIVGDAEAQKLVMKPYRAPWSLQKFMSRA